MFGRQCPVNERQRSWIDAHLDWLVEQFGNQTLHDRVVVPTAEFFAADLDPTNTDDLLALIARLCARVAVDPDGLTIEVFDSAATVGARELPFLAGEYRSTAGDWRQVNGRTVIGIDRAKLDSPRSLVAIIAHELAHQRLHGEQRSDPTDEDAEPLTDLATVFFGLGIYSANVALEFTAGRSGGWSATRLGYLDPRMFGYALARYARLRGERDPDWAKYLDTNPHAYLRRSARFLARSEQAPITDRLA